MTRASARRNMEKQSHASPAPDLPRLRIAMMLESDEPGGAEMMVYRLSDELRGRGHTIIPVGPEHGVGWLGDLFRRGGSVRSWCS